MRILDHIDLRVRSLAEVRSFYQTLLPALGFDRNAKIEGWIQYERSSDTAVAEFFGVTESAHHIAEVDRLAEIVRRSGACHIEGPAYEAPGYYAVFFEDASGNRFEICHRA